LEIYILDYHVCVDLSLKEIDQDTTCMTDVSPDQPPTEVVSVASGSVRGFSPILLLWQRDCAGVDRE
jgi:hypothetical protein